MGESQYGYFFYTPDNKETKKRITLCTVLTEAASESVMEKSSS